MSFVGGGCVGGVGVGRGGRGWSRVRRMRRSSGGAAVVFAFLASARGWNLYVCGLRLLWRLALCVVSSCRAEWWTELPSYIHRRTTARRLRKKRWLIPVR